MGSPHELVVIFSPHCLFESANGAVSAGSESHTAGGRSGMKGIFTLKRTGDWGDNFSRFRGQEVRNQMKTTNIKAKERKKKTEVMLRQYDEEFRNIKPPDHRYGGPKEKVLLYDMACAIDAVCLHIELAKRKQKFNTRSRHWQIMFRELDRISILTRELLSSIPDRVPPTWRKDLREFERELKEKRIKVVK